MASRHLVLIEQRHSEQPQAVGLAGRCRLNGAQLLLGGCGPPAAQRRQRLSVGGPQLCLRLFRRHEGVNLADRRTSVNARAGPLGVPRSRKIRRAAP